MGNLARRGRPALIWALAALLAWGLAQGAWPLIWRLVILPKAAQGGTGLRALTFAQEGLQGQQTSSYASPQAHFTLDKPQSSLRALAVWNLPQDGTYRLRLECDDYGGLRLDQVLLIRLVGVSDHNQGQTEIKLEAGPHLLDLELNNREGTGWLKASCQGPGDRDWRLLAGQELRLVELGNLAAWLKLASYAKVAPWWALGLGLVVWLVHRLLGRLQRPAVRQGEPPRPLFRLGWVLAGLGLTALGLLAADLYLHHRHALQADYHNRRGYRGPLAGPKPVGQVRVAVFGGSGSYGWGQPWTDALPVALEGALGGRRPCPVTVLNLAANEQGIYGIHQDVQLYQDLDYDLAVLYIGGADTVPNQPHLANFRGGNWFFRLFGYMPLAPRLLDELRARWGGDLAGLAHLQAGDEDWALGAPVRFAVGRAAGQANQMLDQVAKTFSASEEQARSMRGKGRPFAFFLEYVEKTLDWLLAHGKQAVCLGEAIQSGSLQQELLQELLKRKYGGRVPYYDAAQLLGMPMSEAFTDGVHFTQAGAAALAQALAPRIEPLLPCPPAGPAGR